MERVNFAGSGIKGLDHILRGGLPRDHLHLIEGDPGTGKTTLALQFLMEGARHGESGLYITFSESKAELEAVARSHGWDIAGIDILEVGIPEDMLPLGTDYTMFHPDEIELDVLIKRVLSHIEKTKPQRVVFDSLSDMRMMARDNLRYRRQILALKKFFSTTSISTVLLLEDRAAQGEHFHQLHSLCHGVITLYQMTMDYGTKRRRLEVVKMRALDFRGGFHDVVIRRGGVTVYPRLVAGEHHEGGMIARISSGVPNLDRLLGGGFDSGTSNLIIGAAGTGKTSLGAQYATQHARAGGKVAFYTFDENRTTLVGRAQRIGMEMEAFVDSGHISLTQIDPAELPPGEFIHMVRDTVENHEVTLIIIDSLHGYLNAMPEEHYLITQMHELFSYLNQKGILTIMSVSQTGLLGERVETPINVSYLADSIVMLRYFEYRGRVKKAISVVKKRSGEHETTIREFQIESSGLKVGEPLHDFSGVLSGIPIYADGKTLDESPKRR